MVCVELRDLAAIARAIETGVEARMRVVERARVDVDRAVHRASRPVVERPVGVADVVLTSRDDEKC